MPSAMARASPGDFGDAAFGLRQLQLVDQRLEPVAVFGKIDGVGRRAEDRHAGLFQRARELQRRLAAELHDHALDAPVGAFRADDLEHVFGRQRLEEQPVGGVVVGRHGLRVAVDHDRLEAGLRQREAGMAAAVVELDALADAVGTAAQNDDLFLVRRLGLADRLVEQPGLVGRIHVGGRRCELGRARIDALEHRQHVEREARSLRTSRFRRLGELGETRIRKAHGLERAQLRLRSSAGHARSRALP